MEEYEFMREDFGFDHNGLKASLYTLENTACIVKVTDHGAALAALIDKTTGIDIVHGFSSCEEYEKQDFYIGATIGRTANRIEKGIFHLDEKEYHVPVNNNGNANHGGKEGFDRKMFRAREYNDRVEFEYISRDGEEGYPGNLHLKVTYRLLINGLAIDYEAYSDQDTLFAPTNHSYFNLDGSEDATNHMVCIHSDRFALSDENGLAEDKLVSVHNTPFDFTSYKKVSHDINEEDEQLRNGAGYDHFYPVSGNGLRLMAEAKGEKIHLSMLSDLPGLHFYTANWLDGIEGKYGHHYKRRSAVCFEAEYMPNAINYPDAKQPILRKNTTVQHTIEYLISHS